MIPDWKTNKVYYSFQSTYDFKPELKELREIINHNNFKHSHISGTKDYYCRDYMPIQLSKNEFVQFKFQPDYLINRPERLEFVTNTNDVLKKNKFLGNFRIKQSEFILDGGNIIKSENKVIITDKVAKDNNLTVEQIKPELEKILKVKVIIIPSYPGEETGHADGLIRFLNENTVLTINLENETNDWKEKLVFEINKADLKLFSLPKAKSPEKDWRYINYLQVSNNIIVPSFKNNRDSDKIVLPYMKNLFQRFGYNIKTLDADRISENGGVLNCFTWNIIE